jgi:UPF0176 protein
MSDVIVAALYKFAPVADPAGLRARLQQVCDNNNILGTLLIAPEGINGTVAGSRTGIDATLAALRAEPGFADLEHKEAAAGRQPFYRLKVKVKKEIVTMGVAGLDPARTAGAYVAPEDWNALIADPATVVIDTRNDYEVAFGTFGGARDPKTASFADFPAYRQNELGAQ